MHLRHANHLISLESHLMTQTATHTSDCDIEADVPTEADRRRAAWVLIDRLLDRVKSLESTVATLQERISVLETR